jgi:hypothetical protein
MKPQLTTELLKQEAEQYAAVESTYPEPTLYGVTDGKAVGTYLEHKFKAHLTAKYVFVSGNSASGIDLPELEVDFKVTSIKQPQSSCPFKSARQKIFGLGYSLLVFVYTKIDDPQTQTGMLRFDHVIFIEKERTADYQITTGLQKILDNKGNAEDLVGFMFDKNLPLDEITAHEIANDLLQGAALITGCLTISNALQWRLQYSRAIEQAGNLDGVIRII